MQRQATAAVESGRVSVQPLGEGIHAVQLRDGADGRAGEARFLAITFKRFPDDLAFPAPDD